MAENEPAANEPATNEPAEQGADTQEVVEQALSEAQASIDDMQQATDVAAPAEPSALDELPQLGESDVGSEPESSIELLGDVDLHVMIELGRTEMLVEDVLKLTEGSVVELDKLAGDPVDVYVNNRLVARGEVLVLNDNFCIRISEIVANLEEQAEAAAVQQQLTEAPSAS